MIRAVAATVTLGAASCGGASYPGALSKCATVTVLQAGAGSPACTILMRDCPDHGEARIDCDGAGTSTCDCAWHSDFSHGDSGAKQIPIDFCTASESLIREVAPSSDVCSNGGGV